MADLTWNYEGPFPSGGTRLSEERGGGEPDRLCPSWQLQSAHHGSECCMQITYLTFLHWYVFFFFKLNSHKHSSVWAPSNGKVEPFEQINLFFSDEWEDAKPKCKTTQVNMRCVTFGRSQATCFSPISSLCAKSNWYNWCTDKRVVSIFSSQLLARNGMSIFTKMSNFSLNQGRRMTVVGMDTGGLYRRIKQIFS